MKKLIITGHDSPTTAQFRRDLAKMQNVPASGTTIWVKAQGELPDKLNGTPFRTGFSRIVWKRSWFDHAIADLQAVRGVKTPLTDNFLRFDANPGDVDWFDDAGWAATVEHFGIAAWIAKQGGLKGIVFDAEPYTKPFVPFDYKAQPEAARHSFVEYLAKARQRGRESMRAMKAEFPDLTILTFFLASYFVESNLYHGPSIPRPGIEQNRALFLHSYGLYLAFLDGWLDEVAPQMRLIDGNEHAYFYTKLEAFFAIAQRIKTEGALLAAPENRQKYKKHVTVSSGIYLDAHQRGLTKPEYEQPVVGAEVLQRNTATALRSADDYVWLWGERGRWWPEPGELSEWKNKEVQPSWEAQIPGITHALTQAQKQTVRLPLGGKPKRVVVQAVPKASGPNLLRNGDFSQGPPPGKEALPGASSDWGDAGAPAGWNYWQEESSKGRFRWDEGKKAAKASGVRSGCFLQTLTVKPGERYVVRARCQASGTGLGSLSVQFKTPGEAKWLPITTRLSCIQPSEKRGDKETFALQLTVPEGAGVLVVLLNVHGQPTENDTLWWESAEVIALR
ncbi:carbohydrate binding domain-containing protein [Armatimonas sp.]|uniref:carbohydrate binding domain-containing protein n=1 Tax=Armatimonas sp. TaxID=1872638 RepID=UPI00286CA9D2|nr:carbohydrate binding domain-containing protein [Armatimonas sp.]